MTPKHNMTFFSKHKGLAMKEFSFQRMQIQTQINKSINLFIYNT